MTDKKEQFVKFYFNSLRQPEPGQTEVPEFEIMPMAGFNMSSADAHEYARSHEGISGLSIFEGKIGSDGGMPRREKVLERTYIGRIIHSKLDDNRAIVQVEDRDMKEVDKRKNFRVVDRETNTQLFPLTLAMRLSGK